MIPQMLILLEPDAYGRFVEAIDAPASPNERLVKTMSAALDRPSAGTRP
jgi:uncharacterized protein (DUF1778 family)